MELQELPQIVTGLSSLTHVQKIKVFAWFLRKHKTKEYFESSDIRECYEGLWLENPSNISQLLISLESKKPKELLKGKKGGYCLTGGVFSQLETQYGQRQATVHVHQILVNLVGKVSDQAEKSYLAEAIVCLRNNAPRAAIIMTWNLAYDHLLDHVVTKHLSDFNKGWLAQSPRDHKNAVQTVANRDEVEDQFKEYKVLEICKIGGIINHNQHRILTEKLVKRNMSAHPNGVSVDQVQAEAFISDLINNVVLTLV